MKSIVLAFLLLFGFQYAISQENSKNSYDKEIEVSIYPNPVRDILHFEANAKIDRVCLFNKKGELVYQLSPENNEVSVGELNSGFYLFCAYIDGKKVKKGILKKV